MVKILTLLFLLIGINGFSQTQAEMNREAYAEYDKTDKELNMVYQKILTEYKGDTIFVANLKKSQRIWVGFRDAELEMKYPDYPNNYYGSIQPTCRAFYLIELTENRIKTLKRWLDETEDGDCNGSVKMK